MLYCKTDKKKLKKFLFTYGLCIYFLFLFIYFYLQNAATVTSDILFFPQTTSFILQYMTKVLGSNVSLIDSGYYFLINYNL